MRFHDLRHTFGTRMAGAGTPMPTLQAWMGHSSIKTTSRYTHVSLRRIQTIVSPLEQLPPIEGEEGN